MKKSKLKAYTLSLCLLLSLLATGCAKAGASSGSTVAAEELVGEEGNDVVKDLSGKASASGETGNSDSAEKTAGAGMNFEDCKDGVSDEDARSMITAGGLSDADILSHRVEEISSCEFGDSYIALDTVSAVCRTEDQTGLLPQTVTKDYSFYFDTKKAAWELLADETTACEVDTSALPGSSWRWDAADSDTLSSIFGGDSAEGDPGKVYLHFLNRLGLFSFNLSNEKNTSDERFFSTVGTGGKLILAGEEGPVEKSFSVKGGSVTDAGVVTMEIEAEGNAFSIIFGTDAQPVSEMEYDLALGLEPDENKVYIENLKQFDLSSQSLADGEWKTQVGLKEGNLSPELSWEAVEGAEKYAVLMIDETTGNKWLHWFALVDKTHLDEGEFEGSDAGFAGPYPPETHEYDVYVVALSGDPKTATVLIDTPGEDIRQRLNDLNIASDGSPGNVLAYGQIKANYTPVSDYYGSR